MSRGRGKWTEGACARRDVAAPTLAAPGAGRAAGTGRPARRFVRAGSAAFLLLFVGLAAASPAAIEPGDLAAVRRALAARRGAPVLLNFWAAWCDPCVRELPDLARVEARFAATGIRVLGVSSDLALEDDGPELRRAVKTVLGKAGVTYPNILYTGPTDPLLEAFDLPGSIPYSILYGADGRELKRWNGQLTLGELESALKKLPRRPKPA